MGLFSGASNDLFCEKHYFLECKTCFRQSPRVLAVRELFNSHCPFNLIHGTFLTVCATESDISQNNEVFHVIMTIWEENYNMQINALMTFCSVKREKTSPLKVMR